MIQARMKNGEDGFTLIELLMVVAIIGVLAAIAFPQLSGYRSRSVRATMFADAKNAASTLESYFIDNRSYAPVDGETATGPTGTLSADLQSFRPSRGNTVTITSVPFAYTVTVSNPASDGEGYIGALNYPSTGLCQWASGQSC